MIEFRQIESKCLIGTHIGSGFNLRIIIIISRLSWKPVLQNSSATG